jgi:hypothetical protein
LATTALKTVADPMRSKTFGPGGALGLKPRCDATGEGLE